MVAIGAIGLSLTACSPPIIGEVGIERAEDGSANVLIRLCRGSVDTLLLEPINSYRLSADYRSQSHAWESVGALEVPLKPAVTEAHDMEMPFGEPALKPYALYRLRAAGRDGNAFSEAFGAEQLTALRPGEILAHADPRTGDFTVYDREQFEAVAAESC